MKKTMIALVAATLLSASLPVYAAEHEHEHENAGATTAQSEMQCAKDCDMLLKDCSREAETLQQRVKKIKAAIKKDGADPQKVDQLRQLQAKLKEANELVKTLAKPGH